MPRESVPPLDDLAREALTGPHAAWAVSNGSALRYADDVAPFAATPRSPQEWGDLAGLAAPTVVFGTDVPIPAGWAVERSFDGWRMTCDPVGSTAGTEVLDDPPAMADLVARTEPGPWRPRTKELGGYRGIRRDGVLVAMAGQRMRAADWVEVSAVCTDPAYRGQGLARQVVSAVLADVAADGGRACLHVVRTNAPAIAVYEALGFAVDAPVTFSVVRPR